MVEIFTGILDESSTINSSKNESMHFFFDVDNVFTVVNVSKIGHEIGLRETKLTGNTKKNIYHSGQLLATKKCISFHCHFCNDSLPKNFLKLKLL